MAKPLTNRRTSDGTLYTRSVEVEAAIDDLADLPRSVVRERLALRSRTAPGFIPSECLVHMIRQTQLDNDQTWFGEIYGTILDRIDRVLPRPDQSGASSGTTSAFLEQVRDRVRDRFIALLIEDRAQAGVALDIFECRFDYVIAKWRASAWEGTNVKARRTQALPEEMGTGDQGDDDSTVAAAMSTICSDPTSRIRLRAMIDTLNDNDRRIMEMTIAGYAIHSTQPDEITISGLLDCDEKTVRNRRNAVIAELQRRVALEDSL